MEINLKTRKAVVNAKRGTRGSVKCNEDGGKSDEGVKRESIKSVTGGRWGGGGELTENCE